MRLKTLIGNSNESSAYAQKMLNRAGRIRPCEMNVSSFDVVFVGAGSLAFVGGPSDIPVPLPPIRLAAVSIRVTR